MGTEPKMFFENEKQILECLRKWQSRLGLSDWYICARICEADDMPEPLLLGFSNVQHENACGDILLLRKEDIPADTIIKSPQEQTLIHELLHFKFVSFELKSREEAYFDVMQHQTIEVIARALFMAEYNLSHDWFIHDENKHGVGLE